ncbi:2'-5' RNA ligase family protein [Pseudarthrobacter sp. NPDC092424]|uniref:2'-5' RNA ligase family protein n=1 Tax=Pseudarthrobacter sp. NPDC092424 TaxID=3364415 RepID=UPI00381B1D8B
MPARNTKPLRNLIFVAFVEEVAEEQVFLRTDWPLHITLVRFDADASTGGDPAAAVAAAADAPARAALGTMLRIGEDAGFGRDGSVPVSLVEAQPQLQTLHEELVRAVSGQGGRILTPYHTLSGYRPHVSHRGTTPDTKRLRPGDAVVLGRIALVDMAPGGDRTIRRILRLWR